MSSMDHIPSEIEGIVNRSIENYQINWQREEDAYRAANPEAPHVTLSQNKTRAIEAETRNMLNFQRCASALEEIVTLLKGKVIL